jgi:ribosomal protein S18 acetylase RimI-like enzyme
MVLMFDLKRASLRQAQGKLGDLQTLRIRLATRADLPDLEWGGEYIHFRRLYAEAFELACRGTALLWLADLNPVGIIGQAFVSLKSGRVALADGRTRAYVYAFRVKPAYRGQGVGTQIMSAIEADLRNRRYQYISLNVAKNNTAALRLYERLGYVVIGDDPGEWSYVDHKGRRQQVVEPAWRMEKTLTARG